MTGPFAFSFDQETFIGNYSTREQALAAAVQALRDRADQPEGIFVGQWVRPDPQTDGYADGLLSTLRDRWQRAGIDVGGLDRVNEQLAAELDEQLQSTLSTWLARHTLVPAAVRVQAVSHYPVPNVHHVLTPVGERETSLIGEA